ncbi:MAG: periplasmic protein thioldisulfide oxidoreductase DsbE [Beijerinckiaceae bacterium]|nr:MAG: periplasmic protein thioldisulfide oxidoreductase DsbE [Beijerinckiaceae bacterium]
MNAPAPRRRSLVAWLPLALFAALVAVFLVRLYSGDPSKLPSALLGKPVPVFTLPPVEGASQPGFSNDDLAKGKVSLVNVFASWCAPCHQEHPLLMALAKDPRFQILGINQKDKAENARRFLGRLGNPYTAVGADADGRISIEWGVYGVPETFVVTGDGRIAYKHVGPLTEESIRDKLIPEIEKALAGK